MVFNSDSYYANKYRRTAWENLALAREYRAEGNVERAALYAKIAMGDMRLSLNFRAIAAMGKKARGR